MFGYYPCAVSAGYEGISQNISFLKVELRPRERRIDIMELASGQIK